MTFSAANTAPPTNNDAAYQLHRPDFAEAQAALQRLYTHQSDTIWQTLLSRAGLTGRETDEASFNRLLAAMSDTNPVMSLCARSLSIRANAYTHLAAARTLIHNAE